jgi:hypothetical protein
MVVVRAPRQVEVVELLLAAGAVAADLPRRDGADGGGAAAGVPAGGSTYAACPHAARRGHAGVLRALLAAGADPWVADADGYTAYDYALDAAKPPAVVAALLEGDPRFGEVQAGFQASYARMCQLLKRTQRFPALGCPCRTCNSVVEVRAPESEASCQVRPPAALVRLWGSLTAAHRSVSLWDRGRSEPWCTRRSHLTLPRRRIGLVSCRPGRRSAAWRWCAPSRRAGRTAWRSWSCCTSTARCPTARQAPRAGATWLQPSWTPRRLRQLLELGVRGVRQSGQAPLRCGSRRAAHGAAVALRRMSMAARRCTRPSATTGWPRPSGYWRTARASMSPTSRACCHCIRCARLLQRKLHTSPTEQPPGTGQLRRVV